VDDVKERLERQRRQEEERELADLRQIQSDLREKEVSSRLKEPVAPKKTAANSGPQKTQSKLLQGVIKRKSDGKKEEDAGGKKAKPALGALADYASSDDDS